MNYDVISKELEKSHKKQHIVNFINYLKKVENEKDRVSGEKKNKWFHYFNEEQAINLFNKVALDGLVLDGETIVIQNLAGAVVLNYNYQAYKNKLLNVYPETKFDIQNVHEGDVFEFRKESGVVKYKHEISNPFETNKKIIGCYCVIKNSRGEFIELLNLDDIGKMRKVAKTDSIWKEWESEMILKSVIKRACKRHFRDIVENIERSDNENYDMNKKSEPELPILTEDHSKYKAVRTALLKGNYTMAQMEEKYQISDEIKAKLLEDETV